MLLSLKYPLLSKKIAYEFVAIVAPCCLANSFSSTTKNLARDVIGIRMEAEDVKVCCFIL